MFAIGCLENLSYPSVADLDIILRIAQSLTFLPYPIYILGHVLVSKTHLVVKALRVFPQRIISYRVLFSSLALYL